MDYNSFSIAYYFYDLDTKELNEKIDRIDQVFAEIFPNQHKRVYGPTIDSETEIIYLLSEPILERDMQKVVFFRSLKAVLDDTSDLHPYFCKYRGEAHSWHELLLKNKKQNEEKEVN